MLILFHDNFQTRHDTFIKSLCNLTGDHTIVHVNSAAEGIEALKTYVFDFISLDDVDGASEIVDYILTLDKEEQPAVVNFHSYAAMNVRKLENKLKSGLIDQTIVTWNQLVSDEKLINKLKEWEEKVTNETNEEEKEATC